MIIQCCTARYFVRSFVRSFVRAIDIYLQFLFLLLLQVRQKPFGVGLIVKMLPKTNAVEYHTESKSAKHGEIPSYFLDRRPYANDTPDQIHGGSDNGLCPRVLTSVRFEYLRASRDEQNGHDAGHE